MVTETGVSKFKDGYNWENVEEHEYKVEGTAPFKGITRQILHADPNLACELRFFDVEPGGYSTFERHEHVHGVMILRGKGECLVGTEVRKISEYDLVLIPPMTWHQFHAAADTPLGFLCMVNVDRDRPQLPNEEQLAELASSDPKIAAFLGQIS